MATTVGWASAWFGRTSPSRAGTSDSDSVFTSTLNDVDDLGARNDPIERTHLGFARLRL